MKRFASRFILLFILCSALVSLSKINIAEAEPKTIVVPDDYPTIQEAINFASEGDIIFVKSGTYNETLLLNKSLSLMGENKETTIINGHNEAPVVYIRKDGVNVTGFTLLNGDYPIPPSPDFPWDTRLAGIHLLHVNYCNVTGNKVANTGCGIWLMDAHENNIIGNYVINNDYGIRFEYSTNNRLRNNSLSNNLYNFYLNDLTFRRSFDNDIDDSNTVDEKSIIYWENKHDSIVSPSAGDVILINCTAITIQDSDSTHNLERIIFINTNNSKIIGNRNATTNLIDSHSNNITDNICHTSVVHHEMNIIQNSGNIRLISSHNNSIIQNLGTISLTSSHNNTIIGNCGRIDLNGGSFNTIEHNNSSGYFDGIQLSGTCNHNSIVGNNLSNNSRFGIILAGTGTVEEYHFANSTTIFGNNIVGNGLWGIELRGAQNTTIVGNNIIENEAGINPGGSNNIFYYNNFINNTQQIINTKSTQSFDNGYPCGGNYWSNYVGTDNCNGVHQNETGEDGIGDSPFVLSSSNIDNYPLIAPTNCFDAGIWERTNYKVQVISNSTVSNFSFNPEDMLIQFKVEGETGTTGFCRVSIPKDLLNTEDSWVVLVDGNSITPTVNEDLDNTYLYFTYDHPTSTTEIIGTIAIPEFPTWTSMLLILIVLTIALAIYKRRLLKTPIQ